MSAASVGELPAAVERFLLPTEDCVVLVRRHPAQLIRPIALSLALMAALIFMEWKIPPRIPNIPHLGLACIIAVAAYLAWRIAEWRVDYFVVTDRRMLLTTGLITRRVSMMPLTKVTDMRFDKPIAGRILGYGVFVMESAGQEQALREVTYIPDPDAVYLEVCDLLFGEDDEEDEEPD